MKHEHVGTETAAPAPQAPAAAPALPRNVDVILALQRSAGNAAVTRMLARQDDDFWEDWGGGTATAADLGPDILAGKYDAATYKADGTGFEDAALDAELQKHGQRIGIDTTLPPGSAAESGHAPKGGDSGGKPVTGQPPWVEVFQDYLSSAGAQKAIPGKPKTTTWAEEDKVAQRLLRIFLTRWTENAQGYVPPAAAELIEHAGAYEANEATNEYGVGVKDAANWCAQASSTALAEAMLKAGLRFNRLPKGMSFKRPRYGVDRQTEINHQAGLYNDWVQAEGRKLGGVLGADGARGTYLLPGDILSFYSAKHGPTSNGHVVTVVRSLDQPTVQVASGNAAGQAVRMEEIVVADPPPGFGSQSKARPKGDKEVWIFSLVRASWLNALVMWVNADGPVPEELFGTLGVERCTPLDEMYGPDGRPAPEKPEDPYAEFFGNP
ncbi:MAG TPA: hypothetical protein VFZ00_03410 [Solirubrobacter sp.]|nr:hypothetical protein [Solirubrobacter sp.]